MTTWDLYKLSASTNQITEATALLNHCLSNGIYSKLKSSLITKNTTEILFTIDTCTENHSQHAGLISYCDSHKLSYNSWTVKMSNTYENIGCGYR